MAFKNGPELFEVLRNKRPAGGGGAATTARLSALAMRGGATTTGARAVVVGPESDAPEAEDGGGEGVARAGAGVGAAIGDAKRSPWCTDADGVPILVAEAGDALHAILVALGLEPPKPAAEDPVAEAVPAKTEAPREPEKAAPVAPGGTAKLARPETPETAAPPAPTREAPAEGNGIARVLEVADRARQTAASIAEKILAPKRDDRGLAARKKVLDAGRPPSGDAPKAPKTEKPAPARERPANTAPPPPSVALPLPAPKKPAAGERTGVFPRVAIRADTAAAAAAAALLLLAVAFLGGRASAHKEGIEETETAAGTLTPVGEMPGNVGAAPAAPPSGRAAAPQAQPTPRIAGDPAPGGATPAPAAATGTHHVRVITAGDDKTARRIVEFLKGLPAIQGRGLETYNRGLAVYVGHFAGESDPAAVALCETLASVEFDRKKEFGQARVYKDTRAGSPTDANR